MGSIFGHIRLWSSQCSDGSVPIVDILSYKTLCTAIRPEEYCNKLGLLVACLSWNGNDGHALLRGALLCQSQCCSHVGQVMITCRSGDDHMVVKKRESIIFGDKLIVKR